MEKKSNKKGKKQAQAKEEIKVKPIQASSIFEKNGKIFIMVNAKPGSKSDQIYAVEEDYIGVAV